jgi:predicted DNA binding CopG/RHH family protein
MFIIMRHQGQFAMRRIYDGTAYDTETGELIKEVGFNDMVPDEGMRLYRTRNGTFFVWEQYMTPNYRAATEITPLSDEKAQKWLEEHANDLVEKYFGPMPEGGAAERRMTLRLPNNLAIRIGAIAEAQKLPVSRYIRLCLEKCAAQDGRPATIV